MTKKITVTEKDSERDSIHIKHLETIEGVLTEYVEEFEMNCNKNPLRMALIKSEMDALFAVRKCLGLQGDGA